MSRFELAQLNIATSMDDMDSPSVADFVANIDRINLLADAAPGFIWRLEEDAPEDPVAGLMQTTNTLVNISVWRDVDALQDFAYRSAHADIMRRRKEWFTRMQDAHLVLWWVPAGHRPSIPEAMEKLATLRSKGATAEAFTFRATYPPPSPTSDPSAGTLRSRIDQRDI